MSASGQSALDADSELSVSLGAVARNTTRVRALIGPSCSIVAALKCDGYGFGLLPVARAVLRGGADAIAVGRIEQAIRLRNDGAKVRILVYLSNVPSPHSARQIESYDLTPTIADVDSARRLSQWFESTRGVFVKLDVGLMRIGLEPDAAAEAILNIASLDKLKIEGLYAHPHVPADSATPSRYLQWQMGRFSAVVDELALRGMRPPTRMAASSALLRLTDAFNLTAVDPGRLLFGMIEGGPGLSSLEFEPAFVRFTSRLVHVKYIDRREYRDVAPVSDSAPLRLGIIPLGSSDGLTAASARNVLVRGQRVPLLEPISLEHARLNLSSIPEATVGDVVTIIGQDGNDSITLDEVAAYRQLPMTATIPISIRESVPRHYLEESE